MQVRFAFLLTKLLSIEKSVFFQGKVAHHRLHCPHRFPRRHRSTKPALTGPRLHGVKGGEGSVGVQG